MIWVAVGGRGTLTGAVLGAVLVNYGKTTFTSGALVPYWAFGVGILVVLSLAASMLRPAIGRLIVGVVVGLAVGALAIPLASAVPTWTLLPYWSFLAAGVGLLAAMGTSWDAGPVGALLGALLFGLFYTPLETVPLSSIWLFALGGLFVVVTLLLPRGVVGTVQHWAAERRARGAAEIANSAAVPEPSPRPAE